MRPCVVSAVKSGAVSPMRRDMMLLQVVVVVVVKRKLVRSRRRSRQRSAGNAQAASHVGNDIVDILAADTEANEPFTDIVAAPARAALRRGVYAAETRRFAHQRERAQETVGSGRRGQLEADDGSERQHLTACD